MPLQDKKFFIFSFLFHLGILFLFIVGLERQSSLAVFENTNKNDVISAVVLGDTAKSKILPKQITSKPLTVKPQQPKKMTETKTVEATKKVIALKKAKVKKMLTKEKDILKPESIFGKNLLTDIKMQTKQQAKIKQKQWQSRLQKTLKEQTEQSLRQQLLNEEIKIKGMQLRQAQGEINKYKALILQSISEHWIIPTQANKHLYCELMIRTAPGGMVLDVQVTKTSGDPSLDSSARAAVLKASPLPVPADHYAFQAFKQFVLKVKPENIL